MEAQSLLRQRPSPTQGMRRLDRNRPSPMDTYDPRATPPAESHGLAEAFIILALIAILVIQVISMTDLNSIKSATQDTRDNTAASSSSSAGSESVNPSALSINASTMETLVAHLLTVNTTDVRTTRDYAVDQSRASRVGKFGVNRQIDPGTVPEDIWVGGGEYQYPTAAEVLNVMSDNAADDLGGTGLEIMTIVGLDANFDVQAESVTLDGTNTVQTNNEFIRVIRMFGTSWGSSGFNTGTVTVVGDVSGYTVAQMEPRIGQEEQALTTIPNGRTACLYNYRVSMLRLGGGTASAQAEVQLMFRYNANASNSGWQVIDTVSPVVRGASTVQREYEPCMPIPERTDIRLEVVYVSTTSTAISGTIDLWVQRDTPQVT